jgi:uncharacterized membrane protein
MPERCFSRTAQAINVTLFLLLLGGSLWVYPSLPDQIPKNMGWSGRDVDYWDTTLLHWLSLPLFTTFFLVIEYAAAYSVRNPQQVLQMDIPNLDTYRRLSARHKSLVTDIIRALSHGMMTPAYLLFAVMQVEIYLVAVGARSAPLFWTWLQLGTMVIPIIGLCLLLIWWMPRYIQRLAKRERTE